MFAVLPSPCTMELEVETSQVHMIDYIVVSPHLEYEKLSPWFDLKTCCGQV